MVSWRVVLSRQACKDARNLNSAGLRDRAERLLKLIEVNPYAPSPPYEKLVGDLAGLLSRRINRQHRLVSRVLQDSRTVHVLRMWTHYE